MPQVFNHLEKGRYLDSVALMRMSRRIEALPGLQAAALMIGTPSNKALLSDAGLLAAAGEKASANDLVIALRADDEAQGRSAVDFALQVLSARDEISAATLPHPRSLAGALELLGQANLALISLPGEFAVYEARRALERGLHVLLFSDNVPLEAEIALKRLARDKGLLMMGPDCGTALIAGTPIAFANAVPRGDIAIVSASGTGLQEVSTLLARAGGGVSQGIGVGGRDLDERVGALGTLAALAALERDAATRTIVLISKPPAASVAARVLERVARCAKPVVVCFLGLHETRVPANTRFARTLRQAAEFSLGRSVDAPVPVLPTPRVGGRWVRGLYCGGTLCTEAQLIFRERGLVVHSAAPLPGAGEPSSVGHLFLDLGDDAYTRTRPHPMLEPEIRNDYVREALRAQDVAVILLDVVIGYGAHANPAGVLAAELGPIGSAGPAIIASVTGTDQDPQVWSRQVAILRAAGVTVASSNAQAAELAASLVS